MQMLHSVIGVGNRGLHKLCRLVTDGHYTADRCSHGTDAGKLFAAGAKCCHGDACTFLMQME